MHDAHIGRRSENNIKCVMHDDLGRKNRTTHYNCRFSAESLALRVIFSVSLVVEHHQPTSLEPRQVWSTEGSFGDSLTGHYLR